MWFWHENEKNRSIEQTRFQKDTMTMIKMSF